MQGSADRVSKQLDEISKWEWSDFYRQVLRGNADNWDSGIPEHHNALVRRVLEENPRLIGSAKAIVIDAKHQVPDPGRNKDLQRHKGYHPETMRHTATHLHNDQYQWLADEMIEWTKSFEGEDQPEEGTDLIVITACKVERHRSIAGKELTAQMLSLLTKELRIEVLRIQGDMPHWDKLCRPECEECSWSGKERQNSVRDTVIEFTKRFNYALNDRSLRRDSYQVEATDDWDKATSIPVSSQPELPELFGKDEYIEGVHHNAEYDDYFKDGKHKDVKVFLEKLDNQSLHLLVSMATEMFDPDDDVGNSRAERLSKIVLYMERYNLNIEIIKRWTKNISKQKGGAAEAPEVILAQSESSQSVRRTAAKSTAMDRNHAPPITPDSPTSDCSMHSEQRVPQWSQN